MEETQKPKKISAKGHDIHNKLTKNMCGKEKNSLSMTMNNHDVRTLIVSMEEYSPKSISGNLWVQNLKGGEIEEWNL